jgi:hypothetical protein
MKNIEKTHAGIDARIWKAIEESGVDTSAIPHKKMRKIVHAIADSIIVGIDEMLGEMRAEHEGTAEGGATDTKGDAGVYEQSEDPAPAAPGTETTLWEGRPFLSLSEHYQITTDRIRITTGLLNKERNDIELFRIHDINHTQHLTERMINIGDIALTFDEEGQEDIILRNVSDPKAVHEIIRTAVLDSRRRQKVTFLESM